MEKQGWAPLVLSSAVPREVSDVLAIVIIGLGSLEVILIPTVLPIGQAPWLILVTVAPTCALASLANNTKRLREELALFAYGGSAWHVGLKCFLRGMACTLIAISPILIIEPGFSNLGMTGQVLFAVVVAAAGGLFYTVPSLHRIRSHEFVEHYKG